MYSDISNHKIKVTTRRLCFRYDSATTLQLRHLVLGITKEHLCKLMKKVIFPFGSFLDNAVCILDKLPIFFLHLPQALFQPFCARYIFNGKQYHLCADIFR